MLGEIRDDRIDVAIHVARAPGLDSLDDDAIAPIRLPERHHEDHRHLESQGEYRRAARRFGGASKERDKRRRQPHHALICHERDRSSGAERARSPPHGLRIVDDRHPDFFAGVIDVGVEEWVGHPAHDRIERNSARGYVCTRELPVADVACDHDGALPLRHDILDFLPALDGLHQLLQSILSELVEERRLDEGAAEVTV